MTDEGERVQGELAPDGAMLRFDVGDLYRVDGSREEPRFEVNEMVLTVEANLDPAVRFSTTSRQRMFCDLEYTLVGPFGREMRFSPELTQMPSLNMTPEIVAAPEFKSKDTQLFIEGQKTQFKIGEEAPLSLVCLTGNLSEDFFVLAFENEAFQKPVLATLLYTNQHDEPRGREFRLEDWSDGLSFSGTISVPADAREGNATLVVNFSEKDGEGERARSLHFPQLIRQAGVYTDQAGEQVAVEGWPLKVELVK